MTRGAWLVVVPVVCLACAHPHAQPIALPAPGVTASLYADAGGNGLAIVDDRRWIEISGDHLVLDDVAQDAALPSLVFEVLSGPGPLAIRACTRDRLVTPDGSGVAIASGTEQVVESLIPIADEDSHIIVEKEVFKAGADLAPSLRCATSGPAGRYLVRVLYSSTALAYHAAHAISVTSAERAHVTSNLSITTPIWHPRDGVPTKALVIAYEGLPGGDALPVELARDMVTLDGSTGTIALPARDVSSRVRRVLAASSDITGSDTTPAEWLQQRANASDGDPYAYVWIWLELPGTRLVSGSVAVTVSYPGEEHEPVTTDTSDPAVTGATRPTDTRLALWADEGMRGAIERTFSGSTDSLVTEHFLATVQNYGTEPREIFVEETLRHDGQRKVTASGPTKPSLAGDTLRTKLSIVPTASERAWFEVTYQFTHISAKPDAM